MLLLISLLADFVSKMLVVCIWVDHETCSRLCEIQRQRGKNSKVIDVSFIFSNSLRLKNVKNAISIVFIQLLNPIGETDFDSLMLHM